MKKILIIRMSSIGDIVLSTSFIESVKNKFPNSKIDFLIKEEFSDIVQNHPLIDNIIAYDKLRSDMMTFFGFYDVCLMFDVFDDFHIIFVIC